MKKNRLVFYVLSILIFQNIFILGKQLKLDREKIIIDYKNEGFFKAINDLEIYNSYLVIADFIGNKVLEYKYSTNEAEFIRSIGQKGKGPGDIERPISISVDNNIISIKDQEFISFFDIEGNFVTKFRNFSSYIDFLYLDKKVYCVGITKNDNLIDIYSIDGIRLNSFNKKYLKFDYEFRKRSKFFIESRIYDGNILSDEEYIYFLNRRFGIIQKFNQHGDILLKKDMLPILGKNAKINADKNAKIFLKSEYNLSKVPIYEVFRESKLVGNEVYILINILEKNKKNKTEIISIDKNNLSLKSRYQLNLSEGEQIRQFTVKIEKDKPIFIASIRSNDGIEELYKIYPIEKP